MIRFKPTLIVRRLRVERLGYQVYDEAFHSGVNIIRGDNSSGKSTILNLLYYGIGGDVTDWSPIALLCTRALVEVSLNGNVATLAREISAKAGQPMEIYGGAMDDALAAPASEWSKYGYRRSDSRESFSQILFRLLDIPEASNEASGNVTIHQILRLMYADQLSPVGTLFKFEQFDPPLLRDTVGRLVFGAYDNELYANELTLKELDKEFSDVDSELAAITRLVGRTEQVLTPSWLEAEERKIADDRKRIELEISEAERAVYETGVSESLSLTAQRQVYEEVQHLQFQINETTAAIDATKFEMADASKFIADLEGKLAALTDSSATSNAFGQITFQYCPACYSAIEADQPAHACHLCKNPFDNERARARIVSLVNDTSRQLRQSRSLQKERENELAQLEHVLEGRTSLWRTAANRLTSLTTTPTSDARQHLRTLQRSAGYIDRQMEDLEGKKKLSAAFEKLAARKAEISGKINTLSTRNDLLRTALANRLDVAYASVERQVLDILHKDLPREQAFIDAKSVQFDFASNKLGVDNQSYFSASSRVILRNSFFLALFSAATQDTSFRHLRLCILDSIEDKGMQVERSHNFQRVLLQKSRAATCEHQVIFATSMIAPELEQPTLTVGHYSTHENPTLEIMS
ncbi:hypothetical protein G6L37_22460 [Agrobacterium rubi]|uniref:AAA family ATPase n=1 Tax=Agrobacterium rubi TaxID=28099 RepID=UPI001574483B|nr:AAA family ATPase [Agrobacterium rubi]NTF08896.1 hypothetical protein [Agrobacterium rubi]NTF21167.1 hypothetical protein [Agrobacterium rubi]NTF28024.1 hypothetical protein [Agrobacterium rubi]